MLGSALRHALEVRDLPVLQLVRGVPASPAQIRWNPAAPAAESAVKESDALECLSAVIHLGGANLAGHRWTSAYKRELVASRVDSTRTLARTLARLRRPPEAFVVASACGFYGDRGEEMLDETSSPGSGFLADLCRQWEDAAQPAVDAGIRVVHLRSGVVLGPGPGALARLVPLFRLGLGGKLGSGRQWMSWISLADAIAAIVFALRTSSLHGPVNLTAPNPVTNAEFTTALADILRRPSLLPVPAFVLRLVLGQMADDALLASARVFPARLAAAGFHFSHRTVEEALRAAFTPAISSRQAALF